MIPLDHMLNVFVTCNGNIAFYNMLHCLQGLCMYVYNTSNLQCPLVMCVQLFERDFFVTVVIPGLLSNAAGGLCIFIRKAQSHLMHFFGRFLVLFELRSLKYVKYCTL